MNNFTARLPQIADRELQGYLMQLDAFIKAGELTGIKTETIEVVSPGGNSLDEGNWLLHIQGDNLLFKKRIGGEWVTESTL